MAFISSLVLDMYAILNLTQMKLKPFGLKYMYTLVVEYQCFCVVQYVSVSHISKSVSSLSEMPHCPDDFNKFFLNIPQEIAAQLPASQPSVPGIDTFPSLKFTCRSVEG